MLLEEGNATLLLLQPLTVLVSRHYVPHPLTQFQHPPPSPMQVLDNLEHQFDSPSATANKKLKELMWVRLADERAVLDGCLMPPCMHTPPLQHL